MCAVGGVTNAPRTNSNAYRKAQDALKYREDMTFSVEEIDAFLPEALKMAKRDEPRKQRKSEI